MLIVILKKLKNKKWLTMCMLLGLIFLIATFSCFPMFEAGSIDVMISNEFEESKEVNNSYPMTMWVAEQVDVEDKMTTDEFEAIVEEYQTKWETAMSGIPVENKQSMLNMMDLSVEAVMTGRRGGVRIAYMPEMEDHIKLLAGTMYDDNEDSGFSCIVSQSVLDNYLLSVDEEFQFFSTADPVTEEKLRIRVAGIFDASSDTDLFWVESPNATDNYIFVSKSTFDKIAEKYAITRYDYKINELYQYNYVNHKNMDVVQSNVVKLKRENEKFDINFIDVIKNYNSGKKTIQVSIWVLQLPILGMVLGFIFMVSKQILEAEKNEMAMLFSRGLKRKQIIFLYAAQSGVIAAAAMVIGIPLGFILCKIAASAKNFLTFSFGNTYLYKMNLSMFGYGFVAALIGLLVIVVPVFPYSKVTIVEHKSAYAFQKKMIWEKFFLDVILLVVSCYLRYNYNSSLDKVRSNALDGSKMDPMIFLNTVLFIVATGLVMLRLCNYLVRLIYRIGRNKWKPATYASFLQITRNFSKQCFISVFLILTISMGIFYANAARTINGNHVARIEYGNGADINVMEKWKVNFFARGDRKTDYDYVEPGFSCYDNLVKNGICTNATKVIRSNDLIVKTRESANTIADCQMMGIHTKEFGETAKFREEWNSNKHWFHYLNALADKEYGVIISRNLANKLEIKEDDKIICTKMGEYTDMKKEERGNITATVVGIVDNWPGYERYSYGPEGEKEEYLVVMNYPIIQKSFRTCAYEVWLKLADKGNVYDVYRALENEEVPLKYLNSIEEKKQKLESDYILQITNGLFTLSFIIAIILCSVGFLIYWISSISQRQLLFGIYRAMGLSVDEINGMLANEHFFSTFLSVLAGAMVGSVSSLLFTKLFALIYLPKRDNVAIYIDYLLVDYVKLGVIILIMIVICLACLRTLVKRMDISKSLKLGED